MHSDLMLERVQELRRQGYSHRRIAAALEVSRGFVQAVLRGERTVRSLQPGRREVAYRPCRRMRCPVCRGVIVLWPCVVCTTRRRRGQGQVVQKRP